MAVRRRTARKTAGTAKKAGARKASRGDARKRLTPAATARGLAASDVPLDATVPELRSLSEDVVRAGGAVIGAYREPLSGKPLLLAALPLKAVEPTPFQRDLSPTHTKRLAEKIESSAAFLDPLIVVRGSEGKLCTPNGRHRLAAAKVLGLRMITCLISADETLAFKILALNTEKAHNLRDRSLEVIRMARALAARSPRAKESSFADELEEAPLLTLGLVYEENGRFAGGAYHPFLKKVDRFSERTLPVSLRERAGFAARIVEIDALVKDIIERLRERGFQSPYLRSYVVARINPVRFHRAKPGDPAPSMPIGAALVRMAAAARKLDAGSVRERDLALVAAVAADED